MFINASSLTTPAKWHMKIMLKEVKLFLSAIRLAPHLILMLLSSNRNLIWADMDRFGKLSKRGQPQNLMERVFLFINLMTFVPEYRTVFYLRTDKLVRVLLSIFCRRMPTLDIIAKSVGPGLFIQHGHGTNVSAEEIGENCWINQLVTIGYINDDGPPTIGNNVIIHAGATILGKLCIGDNSTVGANSLVIRDVPPNVTVLGVPAKIISRKKPTRLDDISVLDLT